MKTIGPLQTVDLEQCCVAALPEPDIGHGPQHLELRSVYDGDEAATRIQLLRVEASLAERTQH